MKKIIYDECRDCGEPYTSIDDVCAKLNEMVDEINEQTKDIKRLWINLIDLQKEVLKTSRWIKEHEKHKS